MKGAINMSDSRLTLVAATVAGLGLALAGYSSSSETSTAISPTEQFCSVATAEGNKLIDQSEVRPENAPINLVDMTSEFQETQSALPSDAPSQVTSAFSDAIRQMQNLDAGTGAEFESELKTISSHVKDVCGPLLVATPSASSTS
jgi:hypothetical protein